MNHHSYDITGLGSGSAAQPAAIAAVKLGEKVTIIDLREVLDGVAPRDRKSLRDAIVYLAVAVLRKPRPTEEGNAATDWRSRMQAGMERESTKSNEQTPWLKRSLRPDS